MAVTCANCGEELLGAVNRCWKCGREVLSTPDAGNAPPVRRAPLVAEATGTDSARSDSEEGIVTARLVTASTHDRASDDSPEIESQPATALSVGGPAASQSGESASPPSNSPDPGLFAVPSVASQLSANGSTDRNSNRLYGWLAIKSVGLGLGTIVLGVFTGWALLLAVPGVVCGMLGTQSPRRMTAVFGLFLCLVGLTVSSVRLAYDTFLFVRGEPTVPFEQESEDDFLFGPDDSMDPPE